MVLQDEQFDWDAFMRDTFEASAAATGAWLRCLYKMRLSVTRGRISWPITSYMRLFGTSQDQAKVLIDEIKTLGIGDAVTESNGNITLVNRRLFRAFKEQEGNKNRQAAYRERHSENRSNGKVTKDEKRPLTILEKEIDNKDMKRKKSVGTRIPNPFPLTDEMIEWANAECPGLSLATAHADFIEYWTNLTTAKAWKVNWMLTWQKGMRLALQWQRERMEKAEIGKAFDDPVPFAPTCYACSDLGEVWEDGGMAPCPKCNPKQEAA